MKDLFGIKWLILRFCIVVAVVALLAIFTERYVGRQTALIVGTFGIIFAVLIFGFLVAMRYVMGRIQKEAYKDLKQVRRKK